MMLRKARLAFQLALLSAAWMFACAAVIPLHALAADWVDVTNNVGGERWSAYGVTYVKAVPGREAVSAGVSECGFWITSDGGASWKKLGGAEIKSRPRRIVLPADSNHSSDPVIIDKGKCFHAWQLADNLKKPAQFIVRLNSDALTAVKSGDQIVVESKGGPLTYKAVVDAKTGGDITQLCLPADGDVIARELNDVFFLGTHGEEYTLRGWTGRNKFTISCTVDLVSQKPDEVVVKVHLVTTGTFKILATDETAKANLKKAHVSYKDKTLEVERTYTFKPDRIVMDDKILWVHPELEMKTFYLTAAFMPGSIQGPARLVNGATAKSFYVTTSGGKKVPEGIVYPSTAENFLKNGHKVSLRTTAMSFDLGKSDMFFFEKPWQQDWFQVSGFMYRLTGTPVGKPIKTSHEVVFSKASASEMPPVVTIKSPSWDARWLDEKGEVAKYKIGDTVKLSASAVNSDGTPVPDEDISWEIHIDPWWNTPSVTLLGNNKSYTIPDVTNEEDKTKSKDRYLLGIVTVKVKGKNETEAVEPFAMLVGRK